MTVMDTVVMEHSVSEDDSEEYESGGSEHSDNENASNSANESANESDNENSGNQSENENSGDENKGVNLGWADSIAKVLKTNKPKGKKTLVLSKAKKLTDLKRKVPEKDEDPGFEIEGEVKEEKPEPEIKEEKVVGPPRKKKKELPSFRVKPDVLGRNREKTLQKIATRGVVQLFNAVRTQQKDIAVKLKEAGPLERKREKVLKNIDKRAFLDVLMGNSKSESVDNPVKSDEDEIKDENNSDKRNQEKSKTGSTWDVLRDDFGMGAKMKDWDKDLSGDDSSEQESVNDSDDED
ncbi:RRP15-like protein [Chrysoperla carnea]|uniref:RRP15-like protein n=1 Tax=Chrysoperla carnea TaxID=189513 RepID=UPI001D0751D2|nr:RRP15-like protein [Chrysoperla carnea]